MSGARFRLDWRETTVSLIGWGLIYAALIPLLGWWTISLALGIGIVLGERKAAAA